MPFQPGFPDGLGRLRPAGPARVIQGSFPAGVVMLRAPRDGSGPVVRGSAIQLSSLPGLVSHSPGQQLPATVQRKMEGLFGADFSDVRVHSGQAVSGLGALAITHGSALHFAHGQYHPDSPRGYHLLAHELTHVLQQRSGRVKNPFNTGVALVQDPLLEAEAERMGLRAALLWRPDGSRPPRGAAPVRSPQVQRRATHVSHGSAVQLARGAGSRGVIQRYYKYDQDGELDWVPDPVPKDYVVIDEIQAGNEVMYVYGPPTTALRSSSNNSNNNNNNSGPSQIEVSTSSIGTDIILFGHGKSGTKSFEGTATCRIVFYNPPEALLSLPVARWLIQHGPPTTADLGQCSEQTFDQVAKDFPGPCPSFAKALWGACSPVSGYPLVIEIGQALPNLILYPHSEKYSKPNVYQVSGATPLAEIQKLFKPGTKLHWAACRQVGETIGNTVQTVYLHPEKANKVTPEELVQEAKNERTYQSNLQKKDSQSRDYLSSVRSTTQDLSPELIQALKPFKATDSFEEQMEALGEIAKRFDVGRGSLVAYLKKENRAAQRP